MPKYGRASHDGLSCSCICSPLAAWGNTSISPVLNEFEMMSALARMALTELTEVIM